MQDRLLSHSSTFTLASFLFHLLLFTAFLSFAFYQVSFAFPGCSFFKTVFLSVSRTVQPSHPLTLCLTPIVLITQVDTTVLRSAYHDYPLRRLRSVFIITIPLPYIITISYSYQEKVVLPQ